LWSSPYERQGEDTVSDDTDKAARDAAWQQCLSRHNYDDHLNVTDISLLHDGFDFGWEAGASHALSRPLSQEEREVLARELCSSLGYDPDQDLGDKFSRHLKWEAYTSDAEAVVAALQRMRTKG
jgi:hypothetical protein